MIEENPRKFIVYDKSGKIVIITSSREIAEYYRNGENIH